MEVYNRYIDIQNGEVDELNSDPAEKCPICGTLSVYLRGIGAVCPEFPYVPAWDK